MDILQRLCRIVWRWDFPSVIKIWFFVKNYTCLRDAVLCFLSLMWSVDCIRCVFFLLWNFTQLRNRESFFVLWPTFLEFVKTKSWIQTHQSFVFANSQISYNVWLVEVIEIIKTFSISHRVQCTVPNEIFLSSQNLHRSTMQKNLLKKILFPRHRMLRICTFEMVDASD